MLKGAVCFVRRHGDRDILTTLHVKSSELCGVPGRPTRIETGFSETLSQDDDHDSGPVANRCTPQWGGRPLVQLAVVVVAGESAQKLTPPIHPILDFWPGLGDMGDHME